MSVACGRIYQGHGRFSDDLKRRQMIFKCLAAHSQYSLPIELHLLVDSHYSLPVEAPNLIVKSKSIKSFFVEIIFLSAFGSTIFLSFRQKCFHSE